MTCPSRWEGEGEVCVCKCKCGWEGEGRGYKCGRGRGGVCRSGEREVMGSEQGSK